MKKLFYFSIIFLLCFTIPAFTFINKANEYAQSKEMSNATVDQVQGCYIYVLSKPIAKYTYLGSVKKGATLTGSAESFFNSIVKKVKKEYPNANGIIFSGIDLDKADVILFNN
jgi:hypothetical protein